ncbi:protease HtpX [Candidatus Gracilibacteria bacterium]|nr:protease HtpX [Candidatus Gracilibacteria bacterium]
MIRRIFLFVLTNIAIIVMGTIILGLIQTVFGIDIIGTLHSSWLSLAIFALIYGFFGSFISLWSSRWMAKRFYHIELLTLESMVTANPGEKLVYQTVEHIAQKNGITMPEVGIYESLEVNAFATGASRNSSLVAVSSGLVAQMNPDEVEGVVAHEMAHIMNGDMVTMTLLQGVINAFVIFLSRAIAQVISMATRRDDSSSNGFVYFGVTILLEILLGILGSLIVMAYSRRREFAADAGSATYVGKSKMVNALKALQRIHEQNIAVKGDPKLAALKIDGKSNGFLHLFASHPPLEERIQHLLNSPIL